MSAQFELWKETPQFNTTNVRNFFERYGLPIMSYSISQDMTHIIRWDVATRTMSPEELSSKLEAIPDVYDISVNRRVIWDGLETTFGNFRLNLQNGYLYKYYPVTP